MKTNTQPNNTFYDYQEKDIENIFDGMENNTKHKLLYQLPTGGGKTVVFYEIASTYMFKETVCRPLHLQYCVFLLFF